MKKSIKKYLLVVLATAMTLLLTACQFKSDDSEVNSSVDIEKEQNNSYDENDISQEANNDASEELSEEAIQLLNILKGVVDEEKILSFCCEDYDCNGVYEAFAFVGQFEPWDDYVDFYSGEVYYVSTAGVDMVTNNEENHFYSIYGNKGEVIDFGARKYFMVEKSYTTCWFSQIYTAVGDTWREENDYSGIGDIGKINGNEFTISFSSYDMMYDASLDSYIGHTWKQYYFYYSEEKDKIVEYEGQEISLEQAAQMCPEGILDEAVAEGYIIDNAILRSNGIININYHEESEDGSIRYKNINYDTVKEVYIEPWGDKVTTWKDSSFDGTYHTSIYGG